MQKNVVILLIALFITTCATAQGNAVAILHQKGFPEEETKETIWPAPVLEHFVQTKQKGRVVLGYGRNNLPVEAYFFPGTSNKRAMVLAGVHGSELAGMEVAKTIVALLDSGEMPFYNVVVVPCLFPANAENATLAKNPLKSGGRYSSAQAADPNRQMPLPGKAFDAEQPCDALQREIEAENRLLLHLIQTFAPTRITNLHAIRDLSKAGICADPRTDCKGLALGFTSDHNLALNMANLICNGGGAVPGNKLDSQPTTLYHKDPAIAAAGQVQKRNVNGSALSGNRGNGISLGTWATTAVCDSIAPRAAIRLITVEFPGYQLPVQQADETKEASLRNIQLYARAVTAVFLQNEWAE